MKSSSRIPLLIFFILLFSLGVFSACNFSPVRSFAPTAEATGFMLPTAVPTQTPTPMPTPTALPMEANCTNYMQYIDDLNYDDGYEADPGEVVTKQWLVKNTGTCNWGPGYILYVTEKSGDITLKESYDLHPALAGSEVTIRLVITVPETEGEYSIRLDPFSPDEDKFPEYISWSFMVKQPSE